MRQRTVKAMISQKNAQEQSWRYGLQLFAGEGGTGDGNDDPGDDDEADDDSDDGKGRKEKKYSDEDVDKMFERKFAEWQKKQEKAKKKQDEAERLQNMNAQERAEHEKEQLQNQVRELLQKDTLSNMAKTARGMLAEKNITVDDELIGMLINEDAEQTKASVEAFAVAFQEAVKKAVKERLKGKTPKTGGSSSKMTKAQILEVKDRAERQRLINENMDLFR